MARKFDLSALMGDVSNLDTLEVVQIPLDTIDPNSGNFYAVDDVTDLKESIELIGLKQPLVVLAQGARYRLIAGHRRYKALNELGRKHAPCVVQRDLTEAQEQLALILTNATARELSYYEKTEQAKQLKELFIKRREEGAELPGRIRDMVADAMRESATNIARMEAIDKHLCAEWKQALKAGNLNSSTAYALSKLPKAAQKKLKETCPDGTVPTASAIKAAAEIAEHQAEQQREADRKADEVYQNSAYRRAQLCILDWAKDKRLDDQSILPSAVCQTVRSLRGISNPTRRTWMPALDDLFGLADALHITLSDLLGLAPELPPYTSEWHRYPLDKPQDGQTVLCRYGISSFDLLVYQGGEFGKVTAGEFVSLPFDVKYWTSAYPEG